MYVIECKKLDCSVSKLVASSHVKTQSRLPSSCKSKTKPRTNAGANTISHDGCSFSVTPALGKDRAVSTQKAELHPTSELICFKFPRTF